jgi:hypothetical protein
MYSDRSETEIKKIGPRVPNARLKFPTFPEVLKRNHWARIHFGPNVANLQPRN